MVLLLESDAVIRIRLIDSDRLTCKKAFCVIVFEPKDVKLFRRVDESFNNSDIRREIKPARLFYLATTKFLIGL